MKKKRPRSSKKLPPVAAKPDIRMGGMVIPEAVTFSIVPVGKGKVHFTFYEAHVDTPAMRAMVARTMEILPHAIPDMRMEVTKGLKPNEAGFTAILTKKQAVDIIFSELLGWESTVGEFTIRDIFAFAGRAVMQQGMLNKQSTESKKLLADQFAGLAPPSKTSIPQLPVLMPQFKPW